MTPLEITSITNFILASEIFLFAGLLLGKDIKRISAASFWGAALLFLGLGALFGGINHGFFEISEERADMQKVAQQLTWISLGIMTFFIFLTAAFQFWSHKVRRIIIIVASIQLLGYAVAITFINNFLIVILNYAPVMLLFLILQFIGLKDGRGSILLIIGIIIGGIASGLQAGKVDYFSPLDRNGLYHVVMMVSAVFLYLGGLKLKRDDSH
jgi:hypothetical protein